MTPPVTSDSLPIEYDAGLVEEAVMLRVSGHPEERSSFHRVRDRIYEVEDGEAREKQFREFHLQWFRRLGLGRLIAAALEEQPVLLQGASLCCVTPAVSSLDEGADLHAIRNRLPEQERVIVVKLRPITFLDTSSLRALLRHEFTHIADMMDPRFGYQPTLPKSELGPTYDNLVRERYRVLWDTWIDGRLLRRGWAGQKLREKRLAEFAATFPMYGEAAIEEKFRELSESDCQTHPDLLAKAMHPGAGAVRSRDGVPRAQPCPLCRFPSFDIMEGAGNLSTDALEAIAADSPEWRPEHGLCRQCADLYQTRRMSLAAEALLPRV